MIKNFFLILPTLKILHIYMVTHLSTTYVFYRVVKTVYFRIVSSDTRKKLNNRYQQTDKYLSQNSFTLPFKLYNGKNTTMSVTFKP